MENFVTAAVFTYAHECTVLKLLLDRQHISFYFQNETMINLLPFHSHALGGIRLKVHPSELERTLEIINEMNSKADLRIV